MIRRRFQTVTTRGPRVQGIRLEESGGLHRDQGTLPGTLLAGLFGGLFAVFALLFAPLSLADTNAIDQELRSLQEVRVLLSDDLAQFEKTLEILLPPGGTPAESSNPAVKNLAAESMRIRERLIRITEREVTLVQRRIALSKQNSEELESRPLRGPDTSLSEYDTAEDVSRLLILLNQYYADLQESLRSMPTAEELARRDAARQDAASLAKIPFSADKVRLNGAEGITALARISQRLSDNDIPESRRDISPICGIKTRLFGSLIASENRSLRPVGKNQYIARVRLQPGDTTLRVKNHTWQLRLPETMDAGDFLITLFLPRSDVPELHIFAVEDMLAEESPYIPAWLPDELNLKPNAG
jgi:hypothetical protein